MAHLAPHTFYRGMAPRTFYRGLGHPFITPAFSLIVIAVIAALAAALIVTLWSLRARAHG